jgi:phospholipid-binding lipoprotein MlaA
MNAWRSPVDGSDRSRVADRIACPQPVYTVTMRPSPFLDPARPGRAPMRPAHALLLTLGLLAGAAPAAAQAVSPSPPPAVEPGTAPPTPPVTTAPTPEPGVEPTAADTVDGAPAVAPADATATDAPAAAPDAAGRTAAELEYDALYGADRNAAQYDPVADPTLPAPANISGAYDPWERFNRKVHRLNNVVDRRVARPLARAYVRLTPRPVRLGVSNFFNNLGQPIAAVNALLQGKPKQAAQSLGRFVLNTTLGIGGVFDPASDTPLPNRSEDFGQTLGVWGWKRSRYLELPLFGPRTVRDVLGMVGDAPLSPLRQVEADRFRVPIQGLQLVDVRTQLLSTDSLREGVEDDYALVRDAWSQRRDYQIFGDRQLEGETDLPDYLLDENNPTVPVDAMPLMPTPGG